jgi:hypothetical protein
MAAIKIIADLDLVAMCFGFLKPSLVGIRSFIGKPYLRGSTPPSNQNVSCVCGCSAVGMSMLVIY